MRSSSIGWLLAAALFAASVSCALDDDGAGDDGTDTAAVTKPPKAGQFPGGFKSPSIVRVGETYHAYFAKQAITIDGKAKTFRVPHATYHDGAWSSPEEVLPALGKGAKANGVVWAPAVARVSADRWMLYYTAQVAPTAADPDTQKKCIWRAHATSPSGPFVDDFDGPLVCQPTGLWSLDAYTFHDAHGNLMLGARIDLGDGINSIQVRQLGPEGEHFARGSAWRVLTRNHQGSWDQHVMENAGIVRLAPPGAGPAHWYVFYSARHWQDNSYSIGYADCGEDIHASGPCTKMTTTGPWLATSKADELYGPGTPTFYSDPSGRKLMSISAWPYSDGEAGADAKQNAREGQIMKTYAITIGDGYKPHLELVRTDR